MDKKNEIEVKVAWNHKLWACNE